MLYCVNRFLIFVFFLTFKKRYYRNTTRVSANLDSNEAEHYLFVYCVFLCYLFLSAENFALITFKTNYRTIIMIIIVRSGPNIFIFLLALPLYSLRKDKILYLQMLKITMLIAKQFPSYYYCRTVCILCHILILLDLVLCSWALNQFCIQVRMKILSA